MAFAAPELLALASLAACAFLIALYYSYGYTMGALLQALAAMFRRLSLNLWFLGNVGLGFIGDALDDVDTTIRNAIGAGITATESGWHYFLHWSAYSFEWIGRQLGDLGDDALAGLLGLRDIVVPRLIAAALAPVAVLLKVHSLLWHYLPEQVHRIMAAALRDLRHAVHAAEAAAIGATLPRLRGLERDAEATAKRIRAVERTLAPAAIVAVVGLALGRLGLGWVRCSNVSRLGKAACGMNSHLLDALLADALVIASTLSIVELTEGLLAVQDEVAGGILLGFRETRGLVR